MGNFMSLSFLAGPMGLFSAGLAIFFGFLWFCFRGGAKSCAVSDGEWSQMSDRLASEKREVSRLLDEARRTTERLERMIDAFERTYYTGEGPNGSVAAIFDGLNDCMKAECHAMAERAGKIQRSASKRTLAKNGR